MSVLNCWSAHSPTDYRRLLQRMEAEPSMADKPTLYIDYRGGKIRGPGDIMGRLFATPKAKSWYPPPDSTIVISDPQRFQQTVARLRELGYPLVETPPAGGSSGADDA